MKKSVWKRLILSLFFINSVYACEIVDDLGNKIKLTHPAQRIISLAPDLTELLFAIGAGQHIIGVVQGSDYPLAAKNIPIVATYNSIEIEKILTLHPDLIVTWAETSYITQLKKLGLPVYLSRQKKLTDIANSMEKLGCLTGTEKIADPSAKQYLKRYQALRTHYANQKKVTVFYQVWSKPFITITKNSWINEVISLCGGINVFANLHGVAPSVDMEAVIVANPDIMIATDSLTNSLYPWHAWPELKAVRFQTMYSIHADLIERAGPRILEGVKEVCRVVSIARNKVV